MVSSEHHRPGIKDFHATGHLPELHLKGELHPPATDSPTQQLKPDLSNLLKLVLSTFHHVRVVSALIHGATTATMSPLVVGAWNCARPGHAFSAQTRYPWSPYAPPPAYLAVGGSRARAECPPWSRVGHGVAIELSSHL